MLLYCCNLAVQIWPEITYSIEKRVQKKWLFHFVKHIIYIWTTFGTHYLGGNYGNSEKKKMFSPSPTYFRPLFHAGKDQNVRENGGNSNGT